MAAISLDNHTQLAASHSLAAGFVESRRRYPARTAVVTRQGTQTYEELAAVAASERRAEVVCEFCAQRYAFAEDELRDLVARA